MDLQDYFEKFKDIYDNFLGIFEENSDIDNFIQLISDPLILESKYALKELFYIVSKVTNQHFRPPNLYDKIDSILVFLKPQIEQNFSNLEIFHIFKYNKLLLLSLINNKILSIDQNIFNEMNTPEFEKYQYLYYFFPEAKDFIDSWTRIGMQNKLKKISTPEKFELNRKNGENESNICKLIRNDSVDEFIILLNQNDITYKTAVPHSIFETNLFLYNSNLNLIEYASFYGSIQIFNYLLSKTENNNEELDSSYSRKLINFALHSNNDEIILFIQDSCKQLSYIFYENCMNESIKCHHKNLSKYFLEQYLPSEKIKSISQTIGIEYFNFNFFPSNLNSIEALFDFCQFDHVFFVDLLLKNKDINVNELVI